MLTKLLLLTTLVCIGNCGINNIPKYDPFERVIDCTNGKNAMDTCDVMLVVESLTSMTYFNITKESREFISYRVAFNSTGNLVPLINPNRDISKFVPPIQTDGLFRTIITINAQMPGPTIIAHHNQTLNITVYNELRNVEGIAIHWHGIHQTGTPEADGVAYITQTPILPQRSFTYTFKASPAGTHWYHAHSGEQRTDGLYGAFIVKDTLPGYENVNDSPDKHTLLLMDWQRETSLNLFLKHYTRTRFFRESTIDDPPYTEYERYTRTYGPDDIGVSPIPFWSGIINDRGRFYNNDGLPNIVNPNCGNLNCFNVSQGSQYRFRLIGAMSIFTYRFSIEGHKVTVVASDGSPIDGIGGVDYVIVNPGERYDIIVHANNTEQRNFWILAETIEDNNNTMNEGQGLYNPISKHRAEAILHYEQYGGTDIAEINITKTCTSLSKCKAVNCPFPQYGTIMECTNVEQFVSPQSFSIPDSIHYPNITMFYAIGFDVTGNFIDGTNFRFPGYPPLTEYADFQNSNNACPSRGCDRDTEPMCVCTQVIDIGSLSRGSVVEIVITNRKAPRSSSFGAPQAMSLHGHYFYVATIGYGEYENGVFANSSDEIECIVGSNNESCPNYFFTVEERNGNLKQEIRWKDGTIPDRVNTQNRNLPRKDTLAVPFGGYAVIRFIVDNPGWWMFHCHIKIDQTAGLAAVIRELPDELGQLTPPPNNECMTTECVPCMAGSSSNLRGSPLMIMVVIAFLSLVLF